VACSEDRIHQFPDGPGPATYSLTVSGPKGAFSASAELQVGGESSPVLWDPEEILAPEKKVEVLPGDNAYVIQVQVACIVNRQKKIKVEATLGDDEYCYEIGCVKGEARTVLNIVVRK
jgi:hypothetical protein